MAKVIISKTNNLVTVQTPNKFVSYKTGVLEASVGSTQGTITLTDTDTSNKVLNDFDITQLVDTSDSVFGATSSAAVTALNAVVNASPDTFIKNTDKITDLTGVTASDFASKPGYGVFVGSTDGSLQTSPKFILDGSNLDVDANMNFVGNKTIGSTGVSGTLTIDPATGINFFGSTNGYNFPTADGSSGQVLQTNGSGTLSFATVSSGGDVVDDTTPQLGGDLDLNSSDITGTGNINITGGVTTSGNVAAFGTVSAVGVLSTLSNATVGGSLSVTGTTNLGTVNVGAKITTPAIDFSGQGGTSTVGISTAGGGSPADLELQSNGNVTIVLDDDDDETDQAFKIESGDGTLIWQVNESGVTSGLLTTVTPTLSGAQSSYQQGSSATLTISNHISGRSYQGAIYNSSGVEQTSNTVTIDSSGNVSFTAPSTIATGYELRIFSADVGKLRSAEVTATFEVTASRNFSYWRLQAVNSSGTQVEDKVFLLEIDFYTGANATGTVYPTAAVASSGSGGGATITSGYFHSATYADWKAFDNSTGSGWWTLGLGNLSGSNEDKNWIQMELTGGAQTIQSVRIRSNTTYTDADYIQILGSNTGDFTGEEILCGTLSGIASSSDVTQNI